MFNHINFQSGNTPKHSLMFVINNTPKYYALPIKMRSFTRNCGSNNYYKVLRKQKDVKCQMDKKQRKIKNRVFKFNFKLIKMGKSNIGENKAKWSRFPVETIKYS